MAAVLWFPLFFAKSEGCKKQPSFAWNHLYDYLFQCFLCPDDNRDIGRLSVENLTIYMLLIERRYQQPSLFYGILVNDKVHKIFAQQPFGIRSEVMADYFDDPLQVF